MVSVIIVNYNRNDLLRQCLDSLRGQNFQDMEIIVVDNASRDDSVEMVCTYYPEVKLIRNTANLLFCRAQNQGISAAKGNFLLCLNSDVILDGDYLKEAISSIGLDPKIGMVSGKILRMDKRTIDSTGLFLGRNRKAVERGYGKQDRGQYDEPGYVFGVSGACAFLRKSMLANIKDRYGYFDERFGMYYEDLDLCWRANKKGWKAYYNPKAISYHFRAGTAIDHDKGRQVIFPYLNKDLQKKYIVNRYRCIKKNDSLPGVISNIPFILVYELKLYCYMAVSFMVKALY